MSQEMQPAASELSAPEREARLAELDELRQRVLELELELEGTKPERSWQRRYYAAYYATTGFMLGMAGAAVSLMMNVIGSLVWVRITGEAQHPLRLIQVYLTFPLGEAALGIDSGLALAIGCCLYLATGAAYGMLFQLVLTRFTPQTSLMRRLAAVSVLSTVVWLVNFYGILIWLQPLLMGGNWIVDLVPWWVAWLTHLVFGGTMVLLYPLGLYTPYRP